MRGLIKLSPLFLGALFLLAACGETVLDDEQSGDRIRPAKLIEVEQRTNQVTLSLPAIIDASLTADLTFELGGRVERLNVIEGQEVQEGQQIARLDQRDIRNQLTTAEAEFGRANSEFQRAERLIVENAISQSVYDQRQSAVEVARANLATARKRLEDTILRAPFAGVIAAIEIEQFENVAPQQPIAKLQTTGDAQARIQVPARVIANQGQSEIVESFIELDAVPGVRLQAEPYELSTVADPSTQTFEATITFTPPEDAVILPGMSGMATATFERLDVSGEEAQAVSVPQSAVQSDGDELYVWIVNPSDMTVTRRNITIQTRLDDSIEVLSGLEPGERIVGAGAAFLHEGMKIREWQG